METLFHGHRLTLAPGRVMTPRATTEALADAALAHLNGHPVRVADVGTGAGGLAVALALGAPNAEVWATDSSRDAVHLARRNVARHGLGERVHVVQGDLLESVPGELDAIVANLPYLPSSEHDAAYDAEPPPAIYAPGDGLGPYRRLARAAAGRLAPSGVLLVQLRGRVVAGPELARLLFD